GSSANAALFYGHPSASLRHLHCRWSGRRRPPCLRSTPGPLPLTHHAVLHYSRSATGICCASGGALWLEVEAPPSLPNRCLHLAYTAGAGLISPLACPLEFGAVPRYRFKIFLVSANIPT